MGHGDALGGGGVGTVGAVLDHHAVRDARGGGEGLGEDVGVAPLVDDDDGVRVVEEVLQLGGDVPVVDVDHHGADLEDRDHGLDGLDGVAAVDRHLVVGPHAHGLQVVGEPVGPVLEFLEGEGAVPLDQDDPVRDAVHAVFDEISDGVRHGYQTRTCYRLA